MKVSEQKYMLGRVKFLRVLRGFYEDQPEFYYLIKIYFQNLAICSA